ncbi:MAG TPA: RNA methyltransferase [Flavobacteriales bacterium]|nr:RNA methyltransferase [Flavobacteriales bacterium]
MSTKAELKWVRSLHQKKYREEEGLYLVQGMKLVTELLRSDQRIHSIHASEAAADHLRDDRVSIWPAHDIERMGTLEHGNEVVAVVHQPDRPHFADPTSDELILALDGITDPGNMGTLLRIADWFGVKRVLCSLDSVEEFNPKCVQASMGSILRVEVHRAHLPRMLDGLRSAGASHYLATMEGESVFNAQLKRPAVLILGSESHGPSKEVRALAAKPISVPRGGEAESLNVAAAASALCMEFLRQRSVV